MVKDPKQVAKGKKNRASGGDFERRVRKDLEEKGWIVDKWSNNVEFNIIPDEEEIYIEGLLIPAKHKFRGPGIPMAMGTGFPDFIVFRFYRGFNGIKTYEIFGVEAKSNGYLTKEEKEKCRWLLDNHIFSKIKIANKTKIKNRIVIEYKEFKNEMA